MTMNLHFLLRLLRKDKEKPTANKRSGYMAAA